MAQTITSTGFNTLLGALSGGAVVITAFSSAGQPYDTASGTMGTVSGGAIDLASNVVLNLNAGETVEELQLQVDGVHIATVDGLNYAFTNAGTLTVTSFEISLTN